MLAKKGSPSEGVAEAGDKGRQNGLPLVNIPAYLR
jgi:hypothetical protein